MFFFLPSSYSIIMITGRVVCSTVSILLLIASRYLVSSPYNRDHPTLSFYVSIPLFIVSYVIYFPSLYRVVTDLVVVTLLLLPPTPTFVDRGINFCWIFVNKFVNGEPFLVKQCFYKSPSSSLFIIYRYLIISNDCMPRHCRMWCSFIYFSPILRTKIPLFLSC